MIDPELAWISLISGILLREFAPMALKEFLPTVNQNFLYGLYAVAVCLAALFTPLSLTDTPLDFIVSVGSIIIGAFLPQRLLRFCGERILST